MTIPAQQRAWTRVLTSLAWALCILSATLALASVALAGLFAARMLGLFLLLPVFAVAASGMPGGDDPARVGLALGMYGLTQAFMQIPFGLASDRWGRRPVVLFGLLLFVVGSVVCAQATDVFWITIGRAIQGDGGRDGGTFRRG